MNNIVYIIAFVLHPHVISGIYTPPTFCVDKEFSLAWKINCLTNTDINSITTGKTMVKYVAKS